MRFSSSSSSSPTTTTTQQQQQHQQHQHHQQQQSMHIGTNIYSNSNDRWFWIGCTMMSQAGVALGLAFETQGRFKRWGSDFSTLVLSIVVLNQVLGPPLCKIGFLMLGDNTVDTEDSDLEFNKTPGQLGQLGQLGGRPGFLTSTESMESTVTGDNIFVDVVTSSTLHPTIKIERRNTEDSDIDEEEEILRRALSSPGTRIRVTQRKNGHPFSTTTPYSSSPLVNTANHGISEFNIPRRTASAYNLLGPRRATSASVSSQRSVSYGDNGNGNMEEKMVVQMRSPSSLLLSRSPTILSALRSRREAGRKTSLDSGRGGRKT